MTITLHWWLVPIVLVAMGVIVHRRSGEFDFIGPMVAFGYWFAAIAFCLGHWL